MPIKPTPIKDRFWRFVVKSDDCWTWSGAKTNGGYGVLQGGRKIGILRAHRLSWEIHNGPLPSHLDVCHRCDNPPCVRPDHLFVGDAAANVADMLAKGRARGGSPAGDRHHQAKLTALKAAEIRQLRNEGLSLNRIAQQYSVSKKTILNICQGKIWR